MLRRTLLILAASSLVSLLGPARAEEPDLAALLKKLPAQDAAGRDSVAKELAALPPAAIGALCRKLGEPGKPDDLGARYALQGLAVYLAQPGLEAQRKVFVQALSQALAAEAPVTVKAFLIQQLRLAATDEAVPALARFLLDKDLCEDAAQALSSAPAPSAAAAKVIREALAKAEGPQRATLVEAAGRLGDKEAVQAILKDATSPDLPLRRAALYALANIADPAAGPVLAKAAEAEPGDERTHATKLYLLYARRRAEGGAKDEAAKILRELYKTRTDPLERHVQCAALWELAAALGEGALPDLLAAMEHPNPEVQAAATNLALYLPGEGVTKQWIEQLRKAAPAARARILVMLTRRGDQAALPAALEALKDADKDVRKAAIVCAVKLGRQDALVPLMAVAEGENNEERTILLGELIQTPGEGLSEAIAGQVEKALGRNAKALLVSALASRGARAQLKTVWAAAKDADENVRAAALDALGMLGDGAAAPDLVKLVVAAAGDRERGAAEKSVIATCLRVADPEARAAPVLAALNDDIKAPARAALLRVLGRLGGAKALAAVRAALSDADAAVQDAALRALADWPEPEPIPDLLKLAQESKDTTQQVIALRGYLNLLKLPSTRPVAETLSLYEAGLKAARRAEEKKQVLAGLGELRLVEALKLVQSQLGDAPLQAEAFAATVKIAKGIGTTSQDEARAALQKVVDECKNAKLVAEAKDALANLSKYEGYITIWEIAGPYTEEGKECTALFDTVFAPEKPEAKVPWRILTDGVDAAKPNLINLQNTSIHGDNRVAYLRTRVLSPKAQEAILEVASDDGIKVWLNDKVIHSNNALRGVETATDKVKASLKEGWNVILLKISQGGGDWGATARLADEKGVPLKGLKVDPTGK